MLSTVFGSDKVKVEKHVLPQKPPWGHIVGGGLRLVIGHHAVHQLLSQGVRAALRGCSLCGGRRDEEGVGVPWAKRG